MASEDLFTLIWLKDFVAANLNGCGAARGRGGSVHRNRTRGHVIRTVLRLRCRYPDQRIAMQQLSPSRRSGLVLMELGYIYMCTMVPRHDDDDEQDCL